MWRFVEGVSKPTEKKSQTTADKRKYYQTYEKSKRSRSFFDDWQRDRPWLKQTENGMVCIFCQEFGSDRTSKFITGCQSNKHDSVVKHESSKMHEKSALIYKAKSDTKSNSVAGKIIQKLNTDIISKLQKMFRNCHALIINNRPLTDFTWLCDLDDVKGLNLGNTYRNPESAKVFLQSIADVEFQNVSQFVEKSKFVCVIGDGSTDSAIKEQEMWFIRSSVSGEIFTKFIGVHCTEKANAANIVSGLEDLVSKNLKIELPDFYKKLAALSCDGASVMLGAKGGVGALLRQKQPSLVSIHCMAHRLELSLKDSSKQIKLYDKCINVLAMGIYYFYHNSALNRAMLVRSFKALKSSDSSQTDVLIPTRVGGTRWVGHTLRALTNLTSSYRYIVQHLGQVSEPAERVSVDSKAKSVAFLRLLKSKDVLCFLHFMMDVLSPLKRLSLLLQDRKCVIGMQHAEIASTLAILGKYRTVDGPHLRKVIDVSEYAGLQLTHCNAVEFKAARTKLLDQVEAALEKRFAEFSSPTVVNATRIAHIQTWPRNWEQLKDYGDEDLRVIMGHYQQLLQEAGVDVPEAELEWTLLKKDVHDGYFKKKEPECPEWVNLHQWHKEKLSNILCVIDLIMTMSPSSAEAERGFSQLKLIKTNIRSRLSQASLNQCLCIKMLAPDIKQFDPLPAINYWNDNGVCSRRPMFKDSHSDSKPVYTLEIQSDSEVPSAAVTVSDDAEEVSTEPQETISEPLSESVSVDQGLYKGFESESDDSDYDSDLKQENVFSKLMMDFRSW